MRFLLLLLFLTACKPVEDHRQRNLVAGRGSDRPIYQLVIPDGWERADSPRPVMDTTKPLLRIARDGIEIVVHSFPGIDIPPVAQLARWERQGGGGEVTPIARGGFVGLQYSSKGVIALAMELDSTLYASSEEASAPWTIKVTGPAEELLEYRDEIASILFSFELVEELGYR